MSTTPVPAATPQEVADFRSEQEKEWGQYIAVTPITVNGALAYVVGDPVPASNVAKYKYDEQGAVAKVSTKAAKETITALHAAATTAADQVEFGAPVTLGVPVPEGK